LNAAAPAIVPPISSAKAPEGASTIRPETGPIDARPTASAASLHGAKDRASLRPVARRMSAERDGRIGTGRGDTPAATEAVSNIRPAATNRAALSAIAGRTTVLVRPATRAKIERRAKIVT
jgi:hypothetical protein